MNDIKRRRLYRWMSAGLWTGLIYSTLYVARPVCEFLKQYSWFSSTINISIILCLIVISVIFFRKIRTERISTYFMFFCITAAYFAGMVYISIPEERLHFIEYGILAFLICRALIVDVKGGKVYFFAFLLTSFLGAGDEGIQHLLPNRYYQFQDVCLNSISGALGLAFVFVMDR